MYLKICYKENIVQYMVHMSHMIASTMTSKLFGCSVMNVSVKKEAAVTQSQESLQDVGLATRAVSSAEVKTQT